MQHPDGQAAEPETETKISLQTSEINDWTNYRDDEVMLQHSAIQAEEAGKIPFVGDKARKLIPGSNIFRGYAIYSTSMIVTSYIGSEASYLLYFDLYNMVIAFIVILFLWLILD